MFENVQYNYPRGFAHIAFSQEGSAVYELGSRRKHELVRIDRRGDVQSVLDTGAYFADPRYAPDGARLTMRKDDEVWVIDLERGIQNRLTHDEVVEHAAIWSPDGRFIAYVENVGGRRRDINLLLVAGDGTPQPFMNTRFDEGSPMFGPNGPWLAYNSNETGEHAVYIASYPEAGTKIRVSTDRGMQPVWSRDGSELFYLNGAKLMVVPVTHGETRRVGTPEFLFELPRLDWADAGHQQYDVSPDGQHFLMLRREEGSRRSEMVVVLNWYQELERLVPTTN